MTLAAFSLAACLVIGWAWDPVPDADLDHYEVQASVVVCNHTLCEGLDENGNVIWFICCDYSPRTTWTPMRSTIEPCVSDADLPLPTCLDCVTFVRICAVDTSGLMSPFCTQETP